VTARAVLRPSWWHWTALGLVALLVVHQASPAHLQGRWQLLTPVLVLAGVLVVRRLWELNPAVNMCIAIVLSIFSGAWFQIGLKGVPLDRVMIAIVLLQFFLRAPGVATVPRLRVRNVHLLMGLTVLYVLASAGAAGTLTAKSSLLSLLDMFGLVPYLMLLVAPAVFSGERERNLLLATLVGLGGYLGLTAIFESLGPHALVFPHYIVRVDAELPDERAGGPFQTSVVEGFATYGCAVAGAIAFSQWRGQRKRYLAAAVIVVCLCGCFLTLERGVWIAAVAATVAAAFTSRAGRRRLVPATLLGAVAIAAALAISPSLSQKASTRVNATSSVWARQNQTTAGLRMVDAKPLFGFGWERYKRDSLDYFRQAKGYPMSGYMLSEGVGSFEPPLPLHDTYLAYLVELGLVGALLWLATLLWGIGGALLARGAAELRPWKTGLLAMSVFYLVVAFVDPHEQAFSLLLLWIWAGVALGSEPLSAQARRAAIARPAGGALLGGALP
jgi:putative inorganic carbon (hco3(-)) transporter